MIWGAQSDQLVNLNFYVNETIVSLGEAFSYCILIFFFNLGEPQTMKMES